MGAYSRSQRMFEALFKRVVRRSEGSGELARPWEAPYDGITTVEDIFYCFRLLLGRSPNREEWRGHSARAGEDLASVVSSYLNSLEFARRELLNQDYHADLQFKQFDGFQLWVPGADLAVGKWILGGEYEPGVSAVFRRVLSQGAGVIDVGANIGWYSMLSASLVGSEGMVLSVEPNPQNAKLVEASRRENGFRHVKVVQAAAGAELGLLALHTSHSNGTTSAVDGGLPALMAATTVPCLRLDDIIPQNVPIRLIKVDVEGAEYLAMKGCAGTIGRHRPVIVSEFSPNSLPGISGVSGQDYLNFLLGFGYGIWVIGHDGTLVDCGQDTARVMDLFTQSDVDHIDLYCEPS